MNASTRSMRRQFNTPWEFNSWTIGKVDFHPNKCTPDLRPHLSIKRSKTPDTSMKRAGVSHIERERKVNHTRYCQEGTYSHQE